MPTFRFNEANHVYTLDGRALESVTQVLASERLIDTTFCDEEGRTRGTYVHAASEMIDRGTLDWDSLDPVLLPYCEAYAQFLADTKPEIILSETPMYHPAHLYAGKPDRIMKLNGVTVVIDLKSGAPVPGTALQLAAYRELARASRGIICSESLSLYLQGDGNYRLHEYLNHARSYNIFLAALAVVRWRKENV
jgi:hypothetical protein